MSLAKLLEKVSTLNTQYSSLVAYSLQEKIFLSYTKKILNTLEEILLDNPHFLIGRLEDFLAQNWKEINGNALCYTALPENELTQLLCEAAEVVALEKNNNQTSINFLMPTVATDSLIDAYPDLATTDIRWVLKNHILGRGGNYLIPVKRLMELERNPSCPNLNVYYDFQLHSDELSFLDKEECERLITHSAETEAYHNAIKEYEKTILAKDNLLIHLRSLCQSLHFNSVAGMGEERNAGQGVYSAIILFNEYYNRLSQDEKLKIPTNVKQEIDLLLELSTDSTINVNATENLNTCIATRRSKLEDAINPVETILSAIGLTEMEQNNLVIEKKNQIALTQQNLSAMLELQTSYHGTDKLYLSSKLMKELSVECTISSMNDLNDFMKLSPLEISDFCHDKKIRIQIINQFNSIESLIFFTIDAKLANLKALFTVIMPELKIKLIHSANNLNALLYTIGKERSQIILETLKDSWQSIFSALDFNIMLSHMIPEERISTFDLMKDYLPGFIREVYDFNCVVKYLNLAQRIEFLELMKNKLSDLCYRKGDAVNIFTHFHDEDFQQIKDLLPHIIQNSSDFIDLMECSTVKERVYIFEGMINHFPLLSLDAFSLKRKFVFFTEEQRSQAFEVLKEPLSNHIKTWYELTEVLKLLSPNQCQILLEKMTQNHQLQFIIQNMGGFATMPDTFELEKFKIIIQAVKGKLTRLLDFSSFLSIFKNINPQQFLYVSAEMKETLTNLAQRTHIRFIIYQTKDILKDEHLLNFLQLIKNGIQWNQVDAEYLKELFKYYFETPEQRLSFLQLLPNLAELISYKELNQFIATYFKDNSEIHQFRQLYFRSLIQNLNDLLNNADEEDKEIITILCNSLKQSSERYFSSKPSPQHFEIFSDSCNQAIEHAQSKLMNPNYCSEIVAIIGLTIISFGIIPAIISVVNKIQHGSWEVRLFKTEKETQLDQMLCPVNSFLKS